MRTTETNTCWQKFQTQVWKKTEQKYWFKFPRKIVRKSVFILNFWYKTKKFLSKKCRKNDDTSVYYFNITKNIVCLKCGCPKKCNNFSFSFLLFSKSLFQLRSQIRCKVRKTNSIFPILLWFDFSSLVSSRLV